MGGRFENVAGLKLNMFVQVTLFTSFIPNYDKKNARRLKKEKKARQTKIVYLYHT